MSHATPFAPQTLSDAEIDRLADALAERLELRRAADPSPEFLTTREVSRITGISVVTLESWRRDDRGPRWSRCGTKSIRYARRDVEMWMASNRAGGAK